jgi:hypothetical protein
MQESCNNLLLTALTDYYNDNPTYKLVLRDIIEAKHKLSLRLIDWFVTHYSKTNNIFYWTSKNDEIIYESCPKDIPDFQSYKRINLYLDYRAQLKSYSKINFDSFRRHDRITFFLDIEKEVFIETTIGQLNFFRWVFNNNVLHYAMQNYDSIYQSMVDNNTSSKLKKPKRVNNNIQEITKTLCTLRFD